LIPKPGITINEIEVRIHGATLNAEGKKTSVQIN